MASLGLDIGTSAVKAAIVDDAGSVLARATSPAAGELPVSSPEPGFAEQDPNLWWAHAQAAIASLDPSLRAQVATIGISYQMHGLVLVDADLEPIRPAILWCDSRAVPFGDAIAAQLNERDLEEHLLNHPGNFTLAKFAWVCQNEPQAAQKTFRWGLPGDYIASKLTGEMTTSTCGLSEMIAWDFKEATPFLPAIEAAGLASQTPVYPLDHPNPVLPQRIRDLGFGPEAKVTYRAGDQLNNALGLGVNASGDTAVSAGTSGVLYGVGGIVPGVSQGVNRFLHVQGKTGVLMCLNGVGAALAFARRTFFPHLSYPEITQLAQQAHPGGPLFFPFGNGAERILGNKTACGFSALDFAQHGPAEIARSVFEGIVFAYLLGSESMSAAGATVASMKGTRSGLFQSELFCQMMADTFQVPIEFFEGDGAVSAARLAHSGPTSAVPGLKSVGGALPGMPPDTSRFTQWKRQLANLLDAK